MNNKFKEFCIIFLFVILPLITFRSYFFKHLIPFPANLLSSFYQPFASYEPNIPNKPMGFDNLRIFYPLRSLTIYQLKNFQLPLWNPYDFSGNVQLATYQSAVFHPLSFLFLLLPQIDAWSIIIILQPFLASLFMYLFLKELKLSRKAAVFGALTFSFSGYMILLWEESFMSVYSALFLPLILYAIEKIFAKARVRYFLLLISSLAFSLLSGWFQNTLYVYLFSIIWVLFRYLFTYKKQIKTVVFIGISYVLSLLVCAIHLVPSFEAYLYSARGTTDAKFIFDGYLAQFNHLITFLAPDFFGNPATYNYFEGRGFYYESVIFIGIIPLIFALYSLFILKKYSLVKKFFAISFIITLSLGFSLPTSWFILYYLKLPFISTIVPSRIFLLSTFTLTVLSALGIEEYFKEKKNILLSIILICLGAIMLGALGIAAIFHFRLLHSANWSQYGVSIKNMVIPLGILMAFTLSIILKKIIRISDWKLYFLIMAISSASFLYMANKDLYFSERKFLFPSVLPIQKLQQISGVNRFWGFNNGHIENNFATYFHLFSPEGYDSIYNSRYGELLAASSNKGQFVAQIPRTDAIIPTDSYEKGIDSYIYRSKLLELLGVKYILEKNSDVAKFKNRDLKNVTKIWNDGIFSIYQYNKAYPRIFLADNYELLTNKKDIISAIFNTKTDLRKTIILEEKPTGFNPSYNLQGSIHLQNYSPNYIKIKTNANHASLLFLSDNYFPGWNAYIDSKTTKIYRADYTFRAIALPKGNHIVEFFYQPQSFTLGVIITLITLLSLPLFGYFILVSLQKKKISVE